MGVWLVLSIFYYFHRRANRRHRIVGGVNLPGVVFVRFLTAQELSLLLNVN